MLRNNLKKAGEECSGTNYTPPATPKGKTRNNPEDAHHIVPLNYAGMERVQAILGFCDVDIDDPKNGVCMDKPSHKQTQDEPNDRDKYVQKITQIFNIEKVRKADGSVDCDKVKDKLSRIKNHLKEQSLISQNGGTPNVDIGGLGL
ncbi:MAG: HNH endonuclease signature motif containing protein [Candidatus Sericytochromatia bacterium]